MPVQEAGAIAVKMEGDEPEFLVVTARRNPDHWIFPKGHLEPGEEPEDAAIRELQEEAGVQGEFVARIGSASYHHDGEDVDVTYYLIRAVTEEDSPEGRTRRWLPYQPARSQLSFDNVREVLDAAARALGIVD